ncbi:MAG: SprT family zinc-dependent metalloprotease [Amylibacter sp.]|nr:SprT family zinc-dependent metalloprotease [Amylibacter sp.]
MTEALKIGNPPITVMLKKSARARKFSLRISNSDGSVSLTMPKQAIIHDAIAFANDHEGWLRKHLCKRPNKILPVFGSSILLDGAEVQIMFGQGSHVRFDAGVLYVSGTNAQVPTKLCAFYKTLARDRLVQASESYAKMVGRSFSRITIRDTRSRWGSCTSDGNLMYSWRLIMAPPSVQAYVAAHEVCHLVEMNHSDAFWRQVAAIYPNYKKQREWLRHQGSHLHRYQFKR